MLDEVAKWDDLVTGLRPVMYGTKGEPADVLSPLAQRLRRRHRSKGDVFAFAPTVGFLELVPQGPPISFPRARAWRHWQRYQPWHLGMLSIH
jgi:hypothetical protein